jgi:hypothetical protein
MRKSHWTPSIIPSDNDQTVYPVAEDFGKLDRAWREAEYETTDLEPLFGISFQANAIIRSASLPSTLKSDGRTTVSEDVAHELRRRCDPQLKDLPSSIQDFVERHVGHGRRQLTLRLV